MNLKNLFFTIVAAAFLSSAIPVSKAPVVGKVAPKIETINGANVVKDANSEGKTQIISFWSPKIPSSRIANRALYKEYGENKGDTEFISICTDSDDILMQEVMKMDGIKDVAIYSYSQISPRVFKDYNVEENPRAFMISSKGKIVKVI